MILGVELLGGKIYMPPTELFKLPIEIPKQYWKYCVWIEIETVPVSFNWKRQPNGSKEAGVYCSQNYSLLLPEVVKTEDEIPQEDGTVKTEKLQNMGVYYSDIILYW